MKKNQQGTWSSVFKEFLIVLLLVCGARWALAEPFLVPSGSMIPSLLVKDYILATKYSYGLRIPFTKTWVIGPMTPERGDVIVFKSKEDNFYFMVKRVVGLPGDKIRMDYEKKQLIINGEPVNMKAVGTNEEGLEIYQEEFESNAHLVQYSPHALSTSDGEFEVPQGHLFMMGDNRDRSSDSRMWGTLPMENVLGKAQFIWMSCDEDAPLGGVFCLGEDLRTERLFKKIN